MRYIIVWLLQNILHLEVIKHPFWLFFKFYEIMLIAVCLSDWFKGGDFLFNFISTSRVQEAQLNLLEEPRELLWRWPAFLKQFREG